MKIVCYLKQWEIVYQLRFWLAWLFTKVLKKFTVFYFDKETSVFFMYALLVCLSFLEKRQDVVIEK